MEMTANTENVEKKEGTELEPVFLELNRVLGNVPNNPAVYQLRKLVSEDDEFKERLDVIYSKARAGALFYKELAQFSEDFEAKIRKHRDTEHPYDVVIATGFMFILLMISSSISYANGYNKELISDTLRNFLTCWVWAGVFGGSVHIQHYTNWFGNLSNPAHYAYAVQHGFEKILSEAQVTLAPTGISLKNLLDEVNSMSPEEIVKGMGEDAFQSLKSEF